MEWNKWFVYLSMKKLSLDTYYTILKMLSNRYIYIQNVTNYFISTIMCISRPEWEKLTEVSPRTQFFLDVSVILKVDCRRSVNNLILSLDKR